MAAPELLHSAPNLASLGEARHLLAEPSQLLDTLRSLGHPYGLLLISYGQLPPSSEEAIAISAFSPLSPFSWLLASGETGRSILGVMAGSMSISLSSESWAGEAPSATAFFSSEHLFKSSAEREPSLYKISETLTEPPKTRLSSSSLLCSLWLSSFMYGAKHNLVPPESIAPPLFYTVQKHEITTKRKREIYINHYSLRVSSTSLKISTYRGQEPFTIKTPAGEPYTQIEPGDPLAALHVSHQAARFRSLSPFEKAQAIVADVTQLLSAIDQADPQTLNPDQQTTLAKAKDATIIGISHLVRLFRRQTGLPTWKLDVLPQLLQRFHALDSQAVSNQFGGKRKVRPSDIEMLVITPTQRRSLLASIP